MLFLKLILKRRRRYRTCLRRSNLIRQVMYETDADRVPFVADTFFVAAFFVACKFTLRIIAYGVGNCVVWRGTTFRYDCFFSVELFFDGRCPCVVRGE